MFKINSILPLNTEAQISLTSASLKLLPGGPCDPGMPCCPLGPGGPGCPGGPSLPGKPGKPGEPSGPLSPAAPLSPGYNQIFFSNLEKKFNFLKYLPVLAFQGSLVDLWVPQHPESQSNQQPHQSL